MFGTAGEQWNTSILLDKPFRFPKREKLVGYICVLDDTIVVQNKPSAIAVALADNDNNNVGEIKRVFESSFESGNVNTVNAVCS